MARVKISTQDILSSILTLREQRVILAGDLAALYEVETKRLNDKTLLLHDSALRDVYQRLKPLLQPPVEPPRKKIGFHPVAS